MPLVKRKPVELFPPPKAAGTDDPDVFYLAATGEVFPDYETYSNRLTFYNQKLFQCELTGRINMTYFEALKSERKEAIELHRLFPEQLKGPVLRSVQFQVTGRIDQLVDLVYERFKDRFFLGEQLYLQIGEDPSIAEKFYARIKSVDPPKALAASMTNGHATKSEDSEDEDDEDEPMSARAGRSKRLDIHRIGSDLSIEPELAAKQDPVAEYTYVVELLDENDHPTGPVHRVKADSLSRDRLAFSKTILRKYMRDCIFRAANIGAEWRVKEWLAVKHGIPTEPTDEIALKNEALKDAKLSKRKKHLLAEAEESTSPASKKVKGEGKKQSAAAKRKADEAEKALMEEAKEAERIRKKNLKYPIEDLELDPISSRELKFQMPGELPRRKERPTPTRGPSALPVPAELFETFIVTYYFLTSLGKPLLLSPFTLDDYQNALEHPTHEPACTLITEIHAVLLNVIVKDGPPANATNKGLLAAGTESSSLPASINGDAEDDADEEAASDVDELEAPNKGSKTNGNANGNASNVDEILQEAINIGKGWESRLLRHDKGRAGWEASLVGLIASRATVETLPRMIGILSHLTGIEHSDGYIKGEWLADTYLSPVDRYPLLEVGDKLQIIDFLCSQAVMTKAVKAFYDECEAQVTELRKEKIEVSRDKRKLAEARDEFEGKHNENDKDGDADEEADGETPLRPTEEELEEGEGTSEEEEEQDELESDSDSRRSGREDSSFSDSGRRTGSRQEILRQKALEKRAQETARQIEQAKAREAHKAKLAENKILTAQRKKLDDEEAKIARRDEAIEREFRRMLLAPRMLPIGRDRFGDKYWWFDGVGSCSLVTGATGEKSTYQTGRIFVQGASQDDIEALIPEPSPEDKKPKNKYIELFHPPITHSLIEKRKAAEHGSESGILSPNEWAVYTEPEQIEELLSWLRIKGHRENHLKSQLIKFRYYIESGMKKRNHDLNAHLRDQYEAVRRSARSKTEMAQTSRLSYMTWRNTLDKGK